MVVKAETNMAENETEAVRKEILAVIYRYGQESGVTVYGVVGVLEAIKADLLEKLVQAREES